MSQKLETQLIECMASTSPGEPLRLYEYPKPILGPWDVEIEVTHCGICHSDIHLLDNEWKITDYPFVPGHEVIGLITQIGDQVKRHKIGMRVGVGWQRGACHVCEWCRIGDENVCEKAEATCVKNHGGFSRKLLIDSRFVFQIPESLSSENAAPLLCGGATVFSPLFDHGISGISKVGVIGIGGLGHFALQFARAFGAEVTAFSTTPSKEEEAHHLGADHFVLIDDTKAMEACTRSFDLILHSGSHLKDPTPFMVALRPYGSLCLLGDPSQTFKIAPLSLVKKKAALCGSNIANPLVMEKMLAFAARHQIQAMTEVFPMQDVNMAIEKLRSNQIRYRAVLKW